MENDDIIQSGLLLVVLLLTIALTLFILVVVICIQRIKRASLKFIQLVRKNPITRSSFTSSEWEIVSKHSKQSLDTARNIGLFLNQSAWGDLEQYCSKRGWFWEEFSLDDGSIEDINLQQQQRKYLRDLITNPLHTQFQRKQHSSKRTLTQKSDHEQKNSRSSSYLDMELSDEENSSFHQSSQYQLRNSQQEGPMLVDMTYIPYNITDLPNLNPHPTRVGVDNLLQQRERFIETTEPVSYRGFIRNSIFVIRIAVVHRLVKWDRYRQEQHGFLFRDDCEEEILERHHLAHSQSPRHFMQELRESFNLKEADCTGYLDFVEKALYSLERKQSGTMSQQTPKSMSPLWMSTSFQSPHTHFPQLVPMFNEGEFTRFTSIFLSILNQINSATPNQNLAPLTK